MSPGKARRGERVYFHLIWSKRPLSVSRVILQCNSVHLVLKIVPPKKGIVSLYSINRLFKVKMSSSSPPPVPTSSQRKECHLARDNYYKCLDEHDKTVGAPGNAESSCKELRKIYEDTCLPSWVKYFERKRAYEKYKAKLQEEGFREEQKK